MEEAIPPDGRTPEQLHVARARLLGLLVEWGVIEFPDASPRRRRVAGAPRLTIVR
jgi:hypothetical protein